MTSALTLAADARPAPHDDADVLAAIAGDEHAFDRLYTRYLPSVYRYLRTRSGGPEDAADLTQLVFLNAFRKLGSYRADASGFAPWLFGIARNAARDAHRRGSAPAISWDIVPEQLIPTAHGATPEAAALAAEAVARVRAAVANLDRDKQELLALRFAAGLTSAQIATVVGKREAAVKKQLWRLVQQLKKDFDE
jgi:RNA polymerase sigma-70 factor (ECF subfamily)